MRCAVFPPATTKKCNRTFERDSSVSFVIITFFCVWACVEGFYINAMLLSFGLECACERLLLFLLTWLGIFMSTTITCVVRGSLFFFFCSFFLADLFFYLKGELYSMHISCFVFITRNIASQ